MRTLGILFTFCVLAFVACDDEGSEGGGGSGGDGANGGEGGGMGGGGGGPLPDQFVHPDGPDGGVCDNFPDEHTTLLNAPTAATVINKVPTHPVVGPEGLP